MKEKFIQSLNSFLKKRQIILNEKDKEFYVKGFRVGRGDALVVVIPENLIEFWGVLKACVEYKKIVIIQASNTGVTGGSTPDSNNYDRDVVIISTRKLKKIFLLDNANQFIALPGSTLSELEEKLDIYGKEPHSVIGSSCIGASIVGGVCNNSGGSLIRRGPAYTEKSLYAYVNNEGELILVNNLGIYLGNSTEEILLNLENFKDINSNDQTDNSKLWANDYSDSLRDITSDSPTRYNGNPKYLYESSGCSGKLAVFAVRLPTFDKISESCSYIVRTNNEQELVELRRHILNKLSELPIQAEYMDRNAFNYTVHYAKHIYKMIDIFGPKKIPQLFAIKSKADNFFKNLPLIKNNFLDILIQYFNVITPDWVDEEISQTFKKYQHMVVIKIEKKQCVEFEMLLSNFFGKNSVNYFKCTNIQEKNIFQIRFAVGGAFIYYCERKGLDVNTSLVSLDVAFRRNDDKWSIELPEYLRKQVLFESCCGHYLCNVSHQDYLLKEGYCANEFKNQVLKYLDKRGAKYPAEHNVGHTYVIEDNYRDHLKKIDPTNTFNPGIGKTSKNKYWV